MRSFFYCIRESFRGFARNFSTAIGSVITVFLSLFVIGVFIVCAIFVDTVAEDVEGEVTLSAYIADDADEGLVNNVREYLESLTGVKYVDYISKEEAWLEFSSSLDPEMAELVDPDILPAKFAVELADPQQVEAVALKLQAYEPWSSIADNPDDPYESIKYSQKTVQQLFSFTNFLRYAAIAVIALMVFIALVFVNNNIRLAVMARRKEIAIMKLVGASNSFVRAPFVMESMLHALLGALLAVGCLELIRRYLLGTILSSFTLFSVSIELNTFLMIYLIIVVVGLVIALFGSLFAIRKYLKI